MKTQPKMSWEAVARVSIACLRDGKNPLAMVDAANILMEIAMLLDKGEDIE